MKVRVIKKEMNKEVREFEEREFSYLVKNIERKELIKQLAKMNSDYMAKHWLSKLSGADEEEYMIDDEIYKA